MKMSDDKKTGSRREISLCGGGVSRKTGKGVPLDAGPDWALRPPVVPRRDFKQNVRSTGPKVLVRLHCKIAS